MAKKTRFQEAREGMLRKLANPKDADDPRWVEDRLKRVDVKEAKAERSLEHKQQHCCRNPPKLSASSQISRPALTSANIYRLKS